ncbi:hypothetical protein TKK_0002093 [Trichogramma kaykai]|uniref:Uncharacterized protein n=1 Tax=Trichogramma kaykai TaxID=54128 RepID=A0ABD2X8R0_9HYME
MKFAKWSANHRSLVEGLVSSSQESVALKMDEAVLTLGLRWLPGPDNFTFQFRPQPASSTVTRRSICQTSREPLTRWDGSGRRLRWLRFCSRTSAWTAQTGTRRCPRRWGSDGVNFARLCQM